jgi:hypothetical protein
MLKILMLLDKMLEEAPPHWTRTRKDIWNGHSSNRSGTMSLPIDSGVASQPSFEYYSKLR